MIILNNHTIELLSTGKYTLSTLPEELCRKLVYVIDNGPTYPKSCRYLFQTKYGDRNDNTPHFGTAKAAVQYAIVNALNYTRGDKIKVTLIKPFVDDFGIDSFLLDYKELILKSRNRHNIVPKSEIYNLSYLDVYGIKVPELLNNYKINRKILAYILTTKKYVDDLNYYLQIDYDSSSINVTKKYFNLWMTLVDNINKKIDIYNGNCYYVKYFINYVARFQSLHLSDRLLYDDYITLSGWLKTPKSKSEFKTLTAMNHNDSVYDDNNMPIYLCKSETQYQLSELITISQTNESVKKTIDTLNQLALDSSQSDLKLNLFELEINRLSTTFYAVFKVTKNEKTR